MIKIDNKLGKRLVIIAPIILLVTVLSISYAYWRKSVTQSEINKVETLTCLSTTITDMNSAINLENEYPIPDSEGLQKKPYTFKVTNQCATFINVNINLEILSTSILDAGYLKAALDGNYKKLTNYPLETATIDGATSYILKNIYLGPKDAEIFDLRLWLDEPTTVTQGSNKTFNSKIVITATAISVKSLPVHLTINPPVNASGIYNSDFAGASWNHKIGGLTINSVINNNQTINLTNKDTPAAVNLADYVMSLASGDEVYNEPETDYRYEGENPNNYLAFNGELWQIIGVFSDNTHGKSGEKLVKIIRNNSLGGFAWDKSNINNWPASSLYNLLNQDYYNGINESAGDYCYQYGSTIKGKCDFNITGITSDYYRNMIEEVTWKLGGIAAMTSDVATVYAAERGTTVYSDRPYHTTGYIGLIYPSDYGYSVLSSSCGRTTNLDSYNNANCAGSTWLRGEGHEWTLTPSSSSAGSESYVNNDGGMRQNNTYLGINTRPVLYLKSNTMKLSGTGSSSDPYIIKAS